MRGRRVRARRRREKGECRGRMDAEMEGEEGGNLWSMGKGRRVKRRREREWEKGGGRGEGRGKGEETDKWEGGI